MKSIAFACIAALTVATVPAHAGGWGSKGNTGNGAASTGGLVNVSPSIQTGSINVLNGTSILNGAAILSGNNTGIGILGTGTGLLNSVTKVTTSKKR